MTDEQTKGMTQIQPWCDVHWTMLREIIDERGLMKWVGDGKAALAQAVRELDPTDTVGDSKGFDPLLRMWVMINSNALDRGFSIFACPGCFLQGHLDTCKNPNCEAPQVRVWFNDGADFMVEQAKEVGMLPKVVS